MPVMDVSPKTFWDAKLHEGRSWHHWPDEWLVKLIAPRYQAGPHGTALELGCGGGNNLWFLHDVGFTVKGLDVSDVAIQQTLDTFTKRGLGVSMSTLFRAPMQDCGTLFPDESFEVVVECKTLQHTNWDEHEQILSSVARILKPGGRFYSVHLVEPVEAFAKAVGRYCYDSATLKDTFPDNGLLCAPPLPVYISLLEASFTVERFVQAEQTPSRFVEHRTGQAWYKTTMPITYVAVEARRC